MKNKTTDVARRGFIRLLGLGAAALVIAPLLRLTQAVGAHVKMTDPLVKALGYVQDASQAVGRKDKTDTCSNCQFYGDATGKADMAKCQLIPGGEVSGSGWCRSYVRRKGAEVVDKKAEKKAERKAKRAEKKADRKAKKQEKATEQ